MQANMGLKILWSIYAGLKSYTLLFHLQKDQKKKKTLKISS